MVEIIKKVRLIFLGAGITNKYQACVNIYDSCGNLVYKGKTKNGDLVLKLKNNSFYTLTATSLGDYINTGFYVRTCKNKYVFIFERSFFRPILNPRTITFLLTDANYNNLPIEEGEINLWQRQ